MYDPKLYLRLCSKTRINPQSHCWEWTGFVHSKRPHPGNRYGGTAIRDPSTKRGSRTMGAHRAMMWALLGPLTPQQCVCHKCDNPVCVNPDHLFIGSMKDNIWDSRRKGRHYESRRDHCERGHPLFGENLYLAPNGTRHCKQCSRDRQRRAWHEKPELRARQLARRREKKSSQINGSSAHE